MLDAMQCCGNITGNKMKPILYLDMDGVLADFERTCAVMFGPDWQQEVEKPNWGRISEVPDLYDILYPMQDAKELYEGCCEFMGNKNKVQILTALPKRAAAQFPDAAEHKTRWARMHIDPNIRVHFGPLAVHKQLHVRHKHDILIDDMKRNIEQWDAAGGVGIWHLNANTSLNTLFYLREFLKTENV